MQSKFLMNYSQFFHEMVYFYYWSDKMLHIFFVKLKKTNLNNKFEKKNISNNSNKRNQRLEATTTAF